MHAARVCIVVMALCLTSVAANSMATARPLSHTVVQGDTLWDLCREYYGDEELWPKLWEMNPFITNPHILRPGDVLTLLKDVPFREDRPGKTLPGSSAQSVETDLKPERGIDVSGLTNVESMGFYTRTQVVPWGEIVADETDRVTVSKGDQVYVRLRTDRPIAPGALLTIYRDVAVADPKRTYRKTGYVVSFLGRLKLEEQVQGEREVQRGWALYRASIVKNFRPIQSGDLVLPFEPVSFCVRPTHPDWTRLRLEEEAIVPIAATKDFLDVLGQFSVVYLPKGHRQGIRRGNLFELVRRNEAEPRISLPYVNLGQVLIVESRSDSSTGVVLTAKEEFRGGAFLRIIDLKKDLSQVSALHGGAHVQKLDPDLDIMDLLLGLVQRAGSAKDFPPSLRAILAIPRCPQH